MKRTQASKRKAAKGGQGRAKLPKKRFGDFERRFAQKAGAGGFR
jgi:hypothetical protein